MSKRFQFKREDLNEITATTLRFMDREIKDAGGSMGSDLKIELLTHVGIFAILCYG